VDLFWVQSYLGTKENIEVRLVAHPSVIPKRGNLTFFEQIPLEDKITKKGMCQVINGYKVVISASIPTDAGSMIHIAKYEVVAKMRPDKKMSGAPKGNLVLGFSKSDEVVNFALLRNLYRNLSERLVASNQPIVDGKEKDRDLVIQYIRDLLG